MHLFVSRQIALKIHLLVSNTPVLVITKSSSQIAVCLHSNVSSFRTSSQKTETSTENSTRKKLIFNTFFSSGHFSYVSITKTCSAIIFLPHPSTLFCRGEVTGPQEGSRAPSCRWTGADRRMYWDDPGSAAGTAAFCCRRRSRRKRAAEACPRSSCRGPRCLTR